MLLQLLLQTTGGAAANGGFDPKQIIFIGLMIVVFYVFMILPQTKKNKAQMKFRSELGKGDKIVNIAGIHGKITELQETTLVIEVEDGSRIRIERSSVNMDATKALDPKKWEVKK